MPGLGDALPGIPVPRPERAVIGDALALLTGVACVVVPLVVALAAACRVASFTSWNFSMN
jgi:hypothetical protein